MRKIWVAALGWGLALTGCGQGSRIAAVVNGQTITVSQVEERMSRLNPAARAAFGNDKGRLLEEMITETILTQEARRRGLERDPEVRRLTKEAVRQILLGRLLETAGEPQAQAVSDEEIQRVYASNPEAMKEPESLRASHILTETEEKAREALDRLKKGEPFAKVASELSTDPTKTRGGDIGFFSKGQLIPEFEAACMKLETGQLSGVVKSALGFHVILLTDRRAARTRPLEEVKEQIRRKLSSDLKQRKLQGFVQELKEKAQVQNKGLFAPPAPDQAQPANAASGS
ncbi:MAG: peptidylprolyl isomerase [Candidatus Omnitrophica bacterium]|nr:peptidylprolyl isomerase [Candidatus Omnitrophota bacterium]